MNIDHYQTFNAEDFILDDNFNKLSKGYSVDGITLDQLKNHYPEKRKEIAFAVEIVKGLSTQKKELSDERKKELLRSILQVKKHQSRLIFLKYAASVLLILGFCVSTLFVFHSQTEIENFASSPRIQSKNAELILVNGKRIEMDSEQSKIEYTADGTTVSLNDTSTVEQSEPVSGKSFNQVIVPYGKRSSILLSDGSRVWLKSGSRLVYPPVFNENKREVFLEGEAYFEVSENKSKPFFVRTDAFRVKVLGTKFLVQAYPSERDQNTILVEGKVNLAKNKMFYSKEYELLPNQKATLSDTDADFRITRVEDVGKSISWIYGYMNFENEDLASLAERISRYYNIKIEISTENVDSKFSGKLDLKENPERILEGLSTIFRKKYEKRGDTFVFYE